MAKSRGQEEEKGRTEEQAQEGNGDDRRKAGGRTIARWKAQAHADLSPEAGDEEVAAFIGRLAREEGYDYDCDAEQVGKWRNNGTWPPPSQESAQREDAEPSPADPSQREGYGLVVLRQLVHLLGKDGVKRLVDSL
jgi:hypothetical protein